MARNQSSLNLRIAIMDAAYSGDTDPLFRSKLTPQQGVVAACYSLTILLFFSHALTF